MNNKGFTVVELLASFGLTMIVCLFLFEVLIDTKDIYGETAIKTEIQEYLGIVSKNIKSTINNNPGSYNCSNNSCTLASDNIVLVETGSAKIKVGNQSFPLPEKITFGNDIVVDDNCLSNDCYVKVSFSLNHPNLPEEYQYNVVFYHNNPS